MPSAMGREFPWLHLSPVATYYEEGRPVEGEFIVSWEEVEQSYAGLDWPPRGPVLALVAAIRRAGYDRTLRAGRSLWDLVVSRSRRHGLRRGQPCIAFCFRPDGGGMEVHVNLGGRERHSFPAIALTPQVEALLGRLAAEAID
jgi:hypothetical protein